MYTVIWPRHLLSQVATIWTAEAERQAVTDSFNRITRELRNAPDAKGIPFGKARLYYDDPLAVMYAAYPGDDIVIVLAVKRITRGTD